MPKLSQPVRGLLLTLHVISSATWSGAAVATLTLALAATHSTPLAPEQCYLAIKLLDDWVVVPAAFTAMSTGVVLALRTEWGLFAHWWVTIKFVITVIVITLSLATLNSWVAKALAESTAGDAASGDGLAAGVVAGTLLNLLGFVGMVWLSETKPRGRTPWSRPRRSQAPQMRRA